MADSNVSYEKKVDDMHALALLATGDFTMADLEQDSAVEPAVEAAAAAALRASAAAQAAAAAGEVATNRAIESILQAGWRPLTAAPTGDDMSKAMAAFAIQCGLPIYVTIEAALYIISTIWFDETLRAQTQMTFQPLHYQSSTAFSFDLMLGPMRYCGALHPSAVQHDPEEPDVKPLDVHTYPIEWPANMPASFNMRAYSVLGMGVIMLASNSRC